jgi:Mitochondrial carrier protein
MSSESSGPPSALIANQETFASLEEDELDYEALPTTSLKVQLFAGAMAGIAEHTIVYPIDAIKVRFLREHVD